VKAICVSDNGRFIIAILVLFSPFGQSVLLHAFVPDGYNFHGIVMNGHFLADEVLNRERWVFFRSGLKASSKEFQSKGQSTAEHKLVDSKQQEPLEAIVTISTEGKSSSSHTLESRYLCLEVETFRQESCNPRYRNCISQLQQKAFWNDDRWEESLQWNMSSDQNKEELRIRSQNRKLKTEVRGLAVENRVLKERLGRLVEFESMFPRCYFGMRVVPVGYNPSVGNSKHEVIPVGYNHSVQNEKIVQNKKHDELCVATNKPKEDQNSSERKPVKAVAVVPAGYNPSVDDDIKIVVEIDDSSCGGDAPEIVNGVDRNRSSTKKRKKRN
jgi:hypothetical protein